MKVTLNNISDRIDSIEDIVRRNSAMLKKSLDINNEQQFLFNHGVQGLIKKIGMVQAKANKQEKIYQLIRNDKSLRFPHRKIMEFLIGQYDYRNDKFNETHFSKLVNECRLGKNKAKEYLDFLSGKGLIEERTDGYRKYFKATEMLEENR